MKDVFNLMGFGLGWFLSLTAIRLLIANPSCSALYRIAGVFVIFSGYECFKFFGAEFRRR